MSQSEAGPLFKLATAPQPIPHTFGAMRIFPKDKTSSGFSQTERTCLVCGATKITVNGDGWVRREWRHAGDTVQLSYHFRPECVAK